MPRKNKRIKIEKPKPISLVKIKHANPSGGGTSYDMFLNPKARKRVKK